MNEKLDLGRIWLDSKNWLAFYFCKDFKGEKAGGTLENFGERQQIYTIVDVISF